MVPKEGLEPSRDCSHTILSRARLPFRHFGRHLLWYSALRHSGSVPSRGKRNTPLVDRPEDAVHRMRERVAGILQFLSYTHHQRVAFHGTPFIENAMETVQIWLQAHERTENPSLFRRTGCLGHGTHANRAHDHHEKEEESSASTSNSPLCCGRSGAPRYLCLRIL